MPFAPEAAFGVEPDSGGGGGETDEGRIRRMMGELQLWGSRNRKDSIRDFVRYWIFKLPAILSSAISAASGPLGASTGFVSIFAVVATICVTIDALWPGGLLHNVHKRAVHDIGLLVGTISTSLDRIAIEKPAGTARQAAFVKILDEMEPERKRIATYVRDAESSLGVAEKK